MNVTLTEQWRDLVEQWREIAEAERVRAGLTRTQLGQRAGLSPQKVTDYLNGHREPSPETMDRILAALGIERTIVPRRKTRVGA